MHLNMSSVNWYPSCLGLNVLKEPHVAINLHCEVHVSRLLFQCPTKIQPSMHGKDRSVNFLSYKVGILQNCLSDGALFPLSCRRHGNAFHIIVKTGGPEMIAPQLSTPGNNVSVLQELCTMYNCEKVELHRSGIMESNSMGAHWIFNHQPHFYTRLFINMCFYRHACFKANYKFHFCTSQIVLNFLHRTLVLFFYIDVILTLYI